ncbi:YkgJ family cysteine cluster protein [Chloroflexota bacterium]
MSGEGSPYLRAPDGREHADGEQWPPIKCFCCGICCTGYQPRIGMDEVCQLAEGLGLSVDDFISRYVQVTKVGYLLRQTGTGCIFLEWEKGGPRAFCSIYPLRPAACRDWVASLSRPQCQEGFKRLKTAGRIPLP